MMVIGIETSPIKLENKTGILIGKPRGTTKKYRNVKKRDCSGLKQRKTVIVDDQE